MKKIKILEKFKKPNFHIITFLLVVLVLGIPYVVTPQLYFPFVTGKVFYFFLLVLLLGLFVDLKFVWQKGFVKVNFLTVILFLFVLANFLSAIFGENFIRSFWGNFERGTSFLFLLFCYLFFLLLGAVLTTKESWMKLFLIITLIATSIASMTIIERIFHWEVIPGDKGGVSFGNDSFLATYLLFGVFISLLVVFEFGKNSKELGFVFLERKDVVFFGTIFFIINLIALYLSHGRAAFISTVGALVFLYLLYLSFAQNDKFLQKIAKGILIPAMLLFIFAVITLQIPNSITQRLFSILNLNRVLVWQSSVEMVKEKPILGWGENNFELAFNKYLNPKMYLLGEIRFDKAHNVIYEVLVTNGILGFVVFLLIYAIVFYYLWRLYIKKEVDFWIPAILTSLFLAHFVQNLTVFDTPTSYVYLFFIFGFISYLVPSKKFQIQLSGRALKFILTILLFGIFALAFYFCVYQPYLSARYAQMASTCSTVQISDKFTYYKKSIDTSLFGLYSSREYLAQFTLNHFDELNLTQIQTTIQELQKTIQEEENDFYGYYLLAQVFNKYGEKFDRSKLLEAKNIITKAITLFPNHLYGYFVLSNTYELLGKPEESLNAILTVLQIEPQYYLAYYHALIKLKKLGNEEKIKEVILLAKENIPQYFPKLEQDLKKEGLDITQFLE